LVEQSVDNAQVGGSGPSGSTSLPV
jgi:hypothetical protein